MADYRPQFRTTYNFGKKTLAERVSDTFYDSFRDKTWKDVKDDYIVTIKNDPVALKNDIKEHYPVYASMILGNAFGAIGNYFSAHTAAEQGQSHQFIELISYAFEYGLHTIISALTYVVLSRVKGDPWSKISTDAASLAVVTTPLQLGVYAPTRTFVADHNMNNGMHPEIATLSAQGELLIPYMVTAKLIFRAFASKVEAYFRPKIEMYIDKRKIRRESKKSEKILLSNKIKKDTGAGGLETVIERVS
jgi:hypothetical protein